MSSLAFCKIVQPFWLISTRRTILWLLYIQSHRYWTLTNFTSLSSHCTHSLHPPLTHLFTRLPHPIYDMAQLYWRDTVPRACFTSLRDAVFDSILIYFFVQKKTKSPGSLSISLPSASALFFLNICMYISLHTIYTNKMYADCLRLVWDICISINDMKQALSSTSLMRDEAVFTLLFLRGRDDFPLTRSNFITLSRVNPKTIHFSHKRLLMLIFPTKCNGWKHFLKVECVVIEFDVGSFEDMVKII